MPSCYLPPPVVEGTGPRGHHQTREPVPAPLQTHVHAQAPHSTNVEDVTRLLNVLAEAPTPGAAIEAQVTRPRVRVEIRCFFREAQGRAAAPPVPFALDATRTSTQSALLPNYGTVEKLVYAETNRGGSSLWTDSPSVSLSRPWLDAQRPHTPPGTHALVVENLGTALSSALLHRKSNLLTPYKPDAGSPGSRHLISSRDTQPCTIVSFMALMLAFLAYQKLMFPLITHLSLSTLRFTTKLWRMNSGRGDTLGHSHRQILRPLLALSSPHPFLWSPNGASRGNIVESMTSPTPTHQTKALSPQSIQILTHTTSPVPGECSQQCASSFTGSHQAPRPPSEMYQRLIAPYLFTTNNGWAWWSASRGKTILSPTSTIALDLPQQEELMACSRMWEWISCV